MALSTAKRHATPHSQQQAGNGWSVDGAWMERKVTITALIFCKNTAYL